MARGRHAGLRSTAALAVLSLAAAGCSTLRQIPVIGRLFVGKPPYYVYATPRYSFEYPRKWGDPSQIDDGVQVNAPDRRASFSIVFLQAGTPDYKPPEDLRRDMTSWGAVEDSHRIEPVALSTSPAYRVQFTTYEYDPETLLGEKVRVLYTQVLAVPREDGIYVVRYRADKDLFDARAYRKQYDHFERSIILAVPPRKAGEEE